MVYFQRAGLWPEFSCFSSPVFSSSAYNNGALSLSISMFFALVLILALFVLQVAEAKASTSGTKPGANETTSSPHQPINDQVTMVPLLTGDTPPLLTTDFQVGNSWSYIIIIDLIKSGNKYSRFHNHLTVDVPKFEKESILQMQTCIFISELDFFFPPNYFYFLAVLSNY